MECPHGNSNCSRCLEALMVTEDVSRLDCDEVKLHKMERRALAAEAELAELNARSARLRSAVEYLADGECQAQCHLYAKRAIEEWVIRLDPGTSGGR